MRIASAVGEACPPRRRCSPRRCPLRRTRNELSRSERKRRRSRERERSARASALSLDRQPRGLGPPTNHTPSAPWPQRRASDERAGAESSGPDVNQGSNCAGVCAALRRRRGQSVELDARVGCDGGEETSSPGPHHATYLPLYAGREYSVFVLVQSVHRGRPMSAEKRGEMTKGRMYMWPCERRSNRGLRQTGALAVLDGSASERARIERTPLLAVGMPGPSAQSARPALTTQVATPATRGRGIDRVEVADRKHEREDDLRRQREDQRRDRRTTGTAIARRT